MLPWDALATFEAVLEEGSFSAASRKLGLSQPTVRRQIEMLEQALQQKLFSRSPAGLLPTDAALRAAAPVREMAAAARSFGRLAANQASSPAGSVRITASEIFASQIMPTIVADLADLYPGITVELEGSNGIDDLLMREADIAIRMVRPKQSGLLARKLGEVELGFFASHRYLANRAEPLSVETMVREHRLISEDRSSLIKAGLAAGGLDLSNMHIALKTDDNVTQLEAIRRGVGVGICLVAIGKEDPALSRILPHIKAHLDVWIVVHEDLRQHSPIRQVFGHVTATLPSILQKGLQH